MTPISKPVISVGTIAALVVLSAIALTIAYHYRAVGGFRDLEIFVAFVVVGWLLVNRKRKGRS